MASATPWDIMASSEWNEFLGRATPLDYRAFLRPEGFDPTANMSLGDDWVCVRRYGALTACGRVRALEWESGFFGMDCVRLEDMLTTPSTNMQDKGLLVDGLLAASNRRGFAACRLGMRDPAMVRALEDKGFRLADAMNIYRITLKAFSPGSGGGEALNPEDDSDARFLTHCIAGMRDGRFLEEPHISRAKGCEYYLRCTLHHLRSGAVSVVVRHQGVRIGFAVGAVDEMMSKALGRRYGYLWLIALAPEFQGRGLGRPLLDGFLQRFSECCDEVEIGTQIGNVAANRLYCGVGAKYMTGLMTLHRFGGGAG
jgi:ribosomal protein S18 acetylase RimI-like enzyme